MTHTTSPRCWTRCLIFLFHLLTSTASCLATFSVNNGNEDTLGASRNVIISTRKNGGHSSVFPQSKPTSSNPDNRKMASTVQVQNLGVLLKRGGKNVQSTLRSTFMPSGYPQKTPPGYLNYSIWSWIQDTSTQLRSVLATQRILEGVGVGREGATALSALMNFLTRDGCGMIATLLFTSVASSRFRSDIKRWRLVADLAVDIGITLEVAAVANPTLFLPMICLGNMCKAVCGVAAGACGGAINVHWAKGSDISDINAKFGAQHTVTGGLGLVFAALFARSVSDWKLWRLWTLYLGLTVAHIVANMRCMRLISFESLNPIRMHIVLSDFLDWWDRQGESRNSSSTTSATPVVPPPSQVSKIEPLFFLPSWLMPHQTQLPKTSVPIFFGESFNDFQQRSQTASGAEKADILLNSPEEVVDVTFNGEKYLISAGSIDNSKGNNKKCVDVVFRSNAAPADEAKAYLHAILLGRELKKLGNDNTSESPDDVQAIAAAEDKVNEDIDVAWNVFQASCQVAGWDLTKTEMSTLGYEIATARET